MFNIEHIINVDICVAEPRNNNPDEILLFPDWLFANVPTPHHHHNVGRNNSSPQLFNFGDASLSFEEVH